MSRSKARARRLDGRKRRPARDSETPAQPLPSAPAWARWGLPLVVAAATFVAFLPALQNGFVNWDDDKVLLENEGFRGLSAERLKWMFTAYWMGHYHPLTWLSFAADYLIWGIDDASGYHLTNLILHALNAVLFYVLAVRLLELTLGRVRGAEGAGLHAAAALAALLFGVHPLRVESVAWVTERRDVLSLSFLIPCVLCYLRYARGGPGRWGWYAASVVLLLLSLLSKAWGITLPALLIVLDIYPLRRIGVRRPGVLSPVALRVLSEKLPFVVIAGWIASQAANAQATAVYTMRSLAEHGVGARLAQAFYGLAFHVWKTVLPTGLAPLYEIPADMNPLEPRFVAAAILVVAGVGVLVAVRRRWPAGPALLAVYVITLSPVLGFAQSGPQLVADRYSYIACMTLALVGGAAALRAVQFLSQRGLRRAAPGIMVGLSVALVTTLGVLTWRQTQVWRTSRTLWEHALTVCPQSRYAHYNLGAYFANRQDYERAVPLFQEAIALYPRYAGAHASLGKARYDQGRVAEAIGHYTAALEIIPEMPQVHRWLAAALKDVGRNDEAAWHMGEAARLEPASPTSGRDPGLRLLEQGRLAEALPHLREAVRSAPGEVSTHFNLGLALGRLQRVAEAAERFEECVRLDPTHFDARCGLGAALAMQGDDQRAIEQYRMALSLRADSADAHARLADLLARQAQAAEAVEHYRAAMQTAPENPGVMDRLARLLATSPEPGVRNGEEAVRLAEAACRSTEFREPTFLTTLAAAYAEAGRFDEAVQTIRLVIPFAEATGDRTLLDELQHRLALYEAGRVPTERKGSNRYRR